jgi:TRAP-type C4-dicarboxylate transport system permease small subunit
MMTFLSIANCARAGFEKITRTMAIIAGGLFLLCAIYVVADILSRAIFGTAPLGGREVSTYVLATGVAGSVAYTFRRRGHIRIDVVFSLLPTRLRTILDVFATAIMALFAFALSYYSWDLALTSFWQSTKSVTSLQTPLFIPQAMMALGFSSLAIEVLLFLLVQTAQIFVKQPADTPSTALSTVRDDP